MALTPVKPGQTFKPQTTGRLKPVIPQQRAPQPRPDVRQSQNYLNALQNAEKYKQEAQQANSFKGMAGNFLKAVPRATADVMVGNPVRFATSVAEIPGIVARGGQTNQRTYNVPGLSPFKSFQSDFQNVAGDVIDSKKGLGSAAWSMAQPVLAGAEILGIGKGLGRAGGAFKAAPTISKGLRAAAPEVLDAFLPTTRGIKKPKVKPLQEGVNPLIQEAGTGPVQGLNKYYPNILRSGERSLENQGSTGKKMLDLMENQRVSGDLQAGKWKSLVNEFTGTLNKDQRLNLTDVLEGKANPMDAQVGASSKVMRNLLDKIQGEAVSSGLNTGKLENYFPRKYNWSEMIKSGRKEQVYQHMVDTGQASTKAEAEQFFKDFIIKNSQRKAGNLEYERMFDIPGYERDPEKALSMYAETAAKRITEAKSFGKGDENISALINKIADEGGDYRSAQKIFDYVYKGEDKNALSRALLGYNAFTKLSLAFFSNLTQSANTAAKGGLLNTIKGAGQALAQGIRATKGKSFDDIAMLSNAFDEHITLQETGLTNKFIQTAMYLFQKVENFNRRTAANTGVLFAKELANNPESAYAIRQLKSLGLDISEIVKGKLTEQQLLTAANKMAKTTQFKANALMMPQAWRTPLGKVLTQFRGFSFMQTKFLRDEVLKEVAKGNLAPLLRFMIIAPVASYVTQSARNVINQSKTQADFRKGDLYRKAIGDLPTDILTQLQYANEKKDKWYTTPLVNVKNFSSPISGPTGGDLFQLMSALEQKGSIQRNNEQWYSKHPAAQSDPNLDLKRFAVQKIPFFGRTLNNTTFGYKPTIAKDAAEMAKQAIENNDRNSFIEAIKKDPYLFNEAVIRNLIDKKIVDMNPNEKSFYEEVKNRKKNNQPFFIP